MYFEHQKVKISSPVSLLHFLNKLIGGERSLHRKHEILDDVISTVDVQETPDNDGQTRGVYLLHVDLDILL